jgi:hypothetical protein
MENVCMHTGKQSRPKQSRPRQPRAPDRTLPFAEARRRERDRRHAARGTLCKPAKFADCKTHAVLADHYAERIVALKEQASDKGSAENRKRLIAATKARSR